MCAFDWYQNHRPWATLNDLERQKCIFAEKMRLLESTAQIRIKIDPYNLRQKCSPIILVSGNLWLMGIFAGVPLGGASNESGVVDDGNFWPFKWLLLRNLQR